MLLKVGKVGIYNKHKVVTYFLSAHLKIYISSFSLHRLIKLKI